MRNAFILAGSGVAIGAIATAAIFSMQPQSYEECILENLPNAKTTRAANLVSSACRELHKKTAPQDSVNEKYPGIDLSGIEGLEKK